MEDPPDQYSIIRTSGVLQDEQQTRTRGPVGFPCSSWQSQPLRGEPASSCSIGRSPRSGGRAQPCTVIPGARLLHFKVRDIERIHTMARSEERRVGKERYSRRSPTLP